MIHEHDDVARASPPSFSTSVSPLTAPLSDKERDERQRLHNRLQTLRDRVKRLESEYADMLDRYRLQEACVLIANVPHYDPHDSLTSRYTDLAEDKEELLKQNESMRAAVATYDKFIRKIQRFVVPKPQADELLPSQLFYQTLSCQASDSHLRSSFARRWPNKRIPRLHCSSKAPSSRRPVCRLTVGVTSDLTRESGSNFTPRRRLPTSLLRIWPLEANQQLYSAQMNPRVYAVQEVDEKNTVLLRVLTGPDGLSLVKFLFLTSLMKTPTGYCVILRWLDSDLLAPQPDQHCVTGVGGPRHRSNQLGRLDARVVVLPSSIRKPGGWTQVPLADTLRSWSLAKDPSIQEKFSSRDVIRAW